MVFESNTLDFLWLQDGNQGSVSGEGLYTWVKYSHNADGSNLSDDSTGMEYIGFAYNKTERIESEDPSDYEWCKIKGDDGEPGTDGYTIILDNENISFTTSSLKIPLNDQTATCKVIVYQGTEQRTNFLIGEITDPIGITIKVENKIIYLSASTSTAIGSLSGSIDIPIQIDGIDFHKKISYSLALKGEDGDSPVSVYLSNENHTFSATSNGKAIASRIQTNIYAYYGSTPVAATVGNLTPPTGMKIDIVNNGQTNTFLNISVDSTLDKNGVLDIPVTVGENTYHCSFSYTLSPQGADGTPAKAIDITPSSQVFKSTDGGTTFSPDKITITPRIQGDIEYSKWQYSTDGGKTWTDITESTNGVSISSTILSIAKSSTLYTETITSIVFKCISNDPNYYDTCTISKLYDVVDIKSDIDAEIKQVKETISGVESKVDKANKSITDKVWQSDVTTIVNNYDSTTGKKVRDRVSKVETNLGGITSTVQDIQTIVTDKADQSTVTELTNRVSKSEQDVNGFKQTVENTYAKQSDLENVNKYAKTSFEQLSDKFSWIVTSQSSETSLTLTDSLISAVTKQFIIKDTSGSATIIEGGKIKANAITTQMLASDALKSTNYAEGTYTDGAGYSKSGTFIDLKTGIFHTPSFYTDINGDTYINGHIVAKSLTLNTDIYIGSVESKKTGFSLSKDGLLQASNAIIYGTIYASDGQFSGRITSDNGKIGNCFLSKDALFCLNTLDANEVNITSAGVGNSKYAFWAGGGGLVETDAPSVGSTSSSSSSIIVGYDPDIEQAPFRVTYDGEVFLDNGNIVASSITAREKYQISCLVKDHDETSNTYLSPETFISGYSYKYHDYQAKELYDYNRIISIHSPEERNDNHVTTSAEISLKSSRVNGMKNGTSSISLYADVIYTHCDLYLSEETADKQVFTLYGNVNGNATSASKLQTSRSLKIGNATKSFNGTANVTWTLSEIGAAASNHKHDILSASDYTLIFTTAQNFYAKKGSDLANGVVNLGASTARFKALYLTGNVNSSSDKKDKRNIADLDERYENMFMDLRPVTYMWNQLSEYDNSVHDRVHCGLIAQEVNEAALNNGLSAMTFAGICRDDLDKPFNGRTERWGLAYNEFTAITIKMVQNAVKGVRELNDELSKLKQENKELKESISRIESSLSNNLS